MLGRACWAERARREEGSGGVLGKACPGGRNRERAGRGACQEGRAGDVLGACRGLLFLRGRQPNNDATIKQYKQGAAPTTPSPAVPQTAMKQMYRFANMNKTLHPLNFKLCLFREGIKSWIDLGSHLLGVVIKQRL